MELIDLNAQEISRLVAKREISAREVLEANLSRIQAVDGASGVIGGDRLLEPDKVHAFITVTSERARRQAHEVDRKIAAGEDAGLLAGVPATVKDIFCMVGIPTTAGSKILSNFSAPYTATPVARMEAAGAVILGKVNLDEFTYGSSSESSAFQPAPRNPWNTDHVPGLQRFLSLHLQPLFHLPTAPILGAFFSSSCPTNPRLLNDQGIRGRISKYQDIRLMILPS